ncbi:MAG TPA: hypothetical protein VMU53_11360 [Candidatus Sulfotelmatobacter sp.]|nr:hypothetical protein [Candidatus Sulfotelmatobacter sp.]
MKMRISHILLLGLPWLIPTFSPAQEKCPWLTEATARGILGGAITVQVNLKDARNGVCDFARHLGPVVVELQIAVNLMTDIPRQFPTYVAQCPAKSAALPAIGNAAVICSVQDKRRYAEKIVGRVRDQAFVVSVDATGPDDPAMTQKIRREKAQLVAEQVAGTLF